MSTREVFIVAAKRTAFGTFGGALKGMSATELAVEASKAALAQAEVDVEKVDHVVFGNVQQTSPDASYLARHVGLKAGVPDHVPALTVNRLCGSGFQAIIEAAQQILLSESEVCLVGGTENMSQAPHVNYGVRWGLPLGQGAEFRDSLWDGLTDRHCGCPMGITAENLADRYDITREQSDEYALRSQSAWAAANEAGRFSDEIAPLTLKTKKGELVFEVDEHPRETTVEKLGKLKPVFKPEGRVTAGSASGICDGAAALVVASGEAVKQQKLRPLARIATWGIAGVDPEIMGIGPAPALRRALSKAEVQLGDLSRVEVNEAFAAQYLAVEKDLGLDRAITNVNGGAIALGHPLGASGARITAHLVYELPRAGGRWAAGSACIGGGQGIAILFESV
jgi:acetyl-CoA acetyltransferase family protein